MIIQLENTIREFTNKLYTELLSKLDLPIQIDIVWTKQKEISQPVHQKIFYIFGIYSTTKTQMVLSYIVDIFTASLPRNILR
jgi:hypothetical protein